VLHCLLSFYFLFSDSSWAEQILFPPSHFVIFTLRLFSFEHGRMGRGLIFTLLQGLCKASHSLELDVYFFLFSLTLPAICHWWYACLLRLRKSLSFHFLLSSFVTYGLQ